MYMYICIAILSKLFYVKKESKLKVFTNYITTKNRNLATNVVIPSLSSTQTRIRGDKAKLINRTCNKMQVSVGANFAGATLIASLDA